MTVGSARQSVSAADAAATGHRRPIRPYINADQATARTDHARFEIKKCGFVREPIKSERGAVIAPQRYAVDEKIGAAMGADVAPGDEFGPGPLPTGHCRRS